MDNAQKAIMIGVGLFITIIVIAAVMLITGMGQDLLNSGTQQLTNISSQLQSSLTQEFDNKKMTGAQALAAIKQYYGRTDMVVQLKNSSGGSVVELGGLSYTVNGSSGTVTENTPTVTISDLTTKTNTNYIVTTAQYTSALVTHNDAVIGIKFTKK